jgi:YD repeat-containing protein
MNMPKRESWALRGAVKSCTIHRMSYPSVGIEGEPRGTTVVEFRPDGFCERVLRRDPRGLEHTTVYEFDDSGRPTKRRTIGPDGWSEARAWEYDAAGRLQRILLYRADDVERIAESYGYDAIGLKTHTRHLDVEAQPCGYWNIDGTDAHFEARGAVGITTFFDADGRATTALFRDRLGHIVNRVDLRYDAHGKLLEEESMGSPLPPGLDTHPLLVVEPMRRLFKYDEHGRRVETIRPCGTLGATITLTSYNQHGDESLTFTEDVDADQLHTERDRTSGRLSDHGSCVRFSYTYDLNGNWITQELEGRIAPDKDFALTDRTYRAITYFPA